MLIFLNCRSAHALALTSRGEMFSWGSNSSGQLGLGDDNLTSSGSVVKIPTVVPISLDGNEDILVGVAAGYAHRLFRILNTLFRKT